MARLEELTRGASIRGVLRDGIVTVVDAKWHGDAVVELTYKDAGGRVGQELLYRDREPALEIVRSGRPWAVRTSPPVQHAGRGLVWRYVSS